MEVNACLIKILRQKRGWTQQQLADIADLNLRTIQRIEKTGSASNESVSALCSSFEKERAELLIVPQVDPSELKPVSFGSIYLMLLIAMIIGGVMGAMLMYWLTM